MEDGKSFTSHCSGRPLSESARERTRIPIGNGALTRAFAPNKRALSTCNFFDAPRLAAPEIW